MTSTFFETSKVELQGERKSILISFLYDKWKKNKTAAFNVKTIQTFKSCHTFSNKKCWVINLCVWRLLFYYFLIQMVENLLGMLGQACGTVLSPLGKKVIWWWYGLGISGMSFSFLIKWSNDADHGCDTWSCSTVSVIMQQWKCRWKVMHWAWWSKSMQRSYVQMISEQENCHH